MRSERVVLAFGLSSEQRRHRVFGWQSWGRVAKEEPETLKHLLHMVLLRALP